MRTYQDLVVWQKAVSMSIRVYEVTADFPKEEQYGLTSQMRRAAVSIPSNIAEGKLRQSERDCERFFRTAFGSGGELETQIIIAKHLEETRHLGYTEIDQLLDEVMRMLNTMIGSANHDS